MRVISGRLGGRQFESTSRATHPMSEKMRGAIFNILGDIYGLRILDCFSGSGALAFEAISRGAKSALAVESDRKAQSDIEKNIELLNLSREVKVAKTTVHNWVNTTDPQKFDVVLADPPYDKLQVSTLESLEGLVSDSGVLVISFPPKADLPIFLELKIVQDKDYGDSRLVFYKKN